MLTLYPRIKAYAKHQVKVDDTHTLYVEETGNPDGLPILFIHGGPGTGSEPQHRRFFDPEVYRIILFDQRGCGQSTPHASIENNTTDNLITDIETIREKLAIDQWLLVGGSWGATLALLYAESFPKRVMGLILRGTFLARNRDIKWLYQKGLNEFFPDYWEDFVRLIDKDGRKDMVKAYHELLTSENQFASSAAAKQWALWETRCSTLHINSDILKQAGELHFALSFAKIACHYFTNKCFIEENQILRRIKHLKSIPGIIVHGRYDMICSLESAWTLHNAWPDSELNIVRDAGHSACEASLIDALVRATRSMAKRFKPIPVETS